MAEPILVGIDTGGTFTDFVVRDGAGLRFAKVLSTPDDPSRAIAEGLSRLGLDEAALRIVHGTTVGTNAVLEGKGARVAYVTSRGFRDVLTLGRQARDEVYALRQPAVAPPVPEDHCLEVSSRVHADGSIDTPSDGAGLAALAQAVASLAPEAVAVNLIFGFLRPEEERRIGDALGSERFVSCASEVLPEPREYERGIATWLNASVGPVIDRYLGRLAARLPEARVAVMQSAGTTIDAAAAGRHAVRLLLSGPAGGLAAAAAVGEATGRAKLLTFDMGGTSTDVSLIDGAIPLTDGSTIGAYPCAVPSVDMHTIGAGGGSLARLDAAGVLLVGPESAGADPGPACYGRGGEVATVTDANVVLGRIPPDTRLGGYLPLDVDAARGAVGRLARAMGCGPQEAAHGVLRIANEHMARALRVMSVARGHDPREYALFCFGGAGGLHACDLAGLLGMRRVMLPAASGVLSALGMLVSRPGRHLGRAVLEPLAEVDDARIAAAFSALEDEAAEALGREGVPRGAISFEHALRLRYAGQSAALTLPWRPGGEHAGAFHAAHEAAYGHRLDQVIELAGLRLAARGPAPLPGIPRREAQSAGVGAGRHAPGGEGGAVACLQRDELMPGAVVRGPAIVTESAATAWVAPGWLGRVDEWGNLALERED